jgi:hypothetical protein
MNVERIKNLIRAFYPFAKTKLDFKDPVKIKYITNDVKNSEDPFGKTAYYNPEEKSITLFILNRHPKDILRSFAHELTHHAQHCRGDFEGQDVSTSHGYAQKNPVLRKAEEEAYFNSILVRDWTDGLQTEEKEEIMKLMKDEEKQHKEVEQARKRIADDENVSDMFTERRNRLNKKLMDKFIKPANKEGNKQ